MKFKSIEELLRFAISKEIASAQFYYDLAAMTKNDDVKNLFLEMAMAEEEVRHKVILESQYDELIK